MKNKIQSNYQSETAELLLKLKAIKLQPNNPFNWASGWKSPIYCDNRIILSSINYRNRIASLFSQLIKEKYKDVEVIAGVATGAIGIGILVAEKLKLPFIYVRPEAKKHGRQNQIEGEVSEGDKIVVIEDLISTGKSSLNAVKALREANAQVKGMLALFSYGFDTATTNFEEAQVQLHTLSNYQHLLEQAEKSKYITKDELETLQQWRKDPANWMQ